MTNKVLKTISEHNLIDECNVLGIGLSGGADSVCLAHILLTNKDVLGIKVLKGIHIHHGIRGEEADHDMEFCRKFCEEFGIELISYCVNVPKEAEKTGESIEACARRLRYDCFSKSGCDKVATAHNLNDNIETFIFNLSRGASLTGLSGIPYSRDIYIRPLLECTRDEIESYLEENNLDFVTDSTNLCDEYTRNKIRHNIIPQLFSLNPSFNNVFLNSIDSVKLANDYIISSAKDIIEKSRMEDGYDCSTFENEHRAIKNQVITLILKEQKVPDVTKKYIDSVLHIIENGGKVSLGGNVTANSDQRKLFFYDIEDVEHFEIVIENTTDMVETPVGRVVFDYLLKKDLQNLKKSDKQMLVDCDKIVGTLSVRNKIDGDSYQPANRVNKKLKKLFNEEKISVYERSKMHILTDECGIVWTEYFGVSERCKIKNNTEKCIKISVVGE